MSKDIILQYRKGRDDAHRISDHFTVGEFNCPCDQCVITLVNVELVKKLEKMRGLLGGPIKITSGYRCHHKQQQLRLAGYETSTGQSTHELGAAVDISNGVTPGHELEDLARKAGFESVGVGKLFVHVDLRPEHRRWTYKS